MRGVVVRYSDFNGFGFVRASGDKDYFVHFSQIEMDGFRTLASGQVVEFTPVSTNRGLQAREVRIINSEATPNRDESEDERLILKKNPFTPQDPITDPSRFAGRREPFRNAVDALFNSKNLLIYGPRGIGKSSMAYQLLRLTQGERALIERLGIDMGDAAFYYASGDYRCVPGNDLVDIASGLTTSLKLSLGKNSRVKERSLTFELDLKIIKAKMDTASEPVSTSDISAQFVADIEAILERVDGIVTGVSFLIDEIDVLQETVQIAPFLKAVVEKFRLDGYDNVSFMVSGVTGTITNMVAQHQSSARLFETLELTRMSDEELLELIALTLQGTGVEMGEDARHRILALSNRFPQPVHLLGYHSFRIDRDNLIDAEDVERAVEFTVQKLKRQEFADKLETYGRGAMRDILRVFAVAPLETVNFAYLTTKLPGIPVSEVAGNIGRLEQWGILEKQYQGVFRLREPLFKIYLRWVFGID